MKRGVFRGRARVRGLQLGPFRLVGLRMPGLPAFGYGPIATTTDPVAHPCGARVCMDFTGYALIVAGRGLAVLRRTVVILP